jgi:hypothetical protein
MFWRQTDKPICPVSAELTGFGLQCILGQSQSILPLTRTAETIAYSVQAQYIFLFIKVSLDVRAQMFPCLVCIRVEEAVVIQVDEAKSRMRFRSS